MHCSACGEHLPHAPPVTCPECGTAHWRNAKPCAGALVVRGGRLLLVRRTIEPWSGCWDIPGGFCDPEEHPITTAEREVAEETGLTVRVTGLLGMWLDSYGDAAGRGDPATTTLNIYFHAVPTDDRPAVADPDEADAAEWFGPDDLPAAIAFAGHARTVLAAWRDTLRERQTVTPLPDRPLRSGRASAG